MRERISDEYIRSLREHQRGRISFCHIETISKEDRLKVTNNLSDDTQRERNSFCVIERVSKESRKNFERGSLRRRKMSRLRKSISEEGNVLETTRANCTISTRLLGGTNR